MKTVTRLMIVCILAGASLLLGLALLTIGPAQADLSPKRQKKSLKLSGPGLITAPVAGRDANPPTFPPNPLITPTNGALVTTARPLFDWADASDPDGVLSYTLLLTGDTILVGLSGAVTALLTSTISAYTPPQDLPNSSYTWTVRAHDTAGNAGGYVTPTTFSLSAVRQLYLPLVIGSECAVSTGASYDLIPIQGPPADHPDYAHGDLNLSLRGYISTTGQLELVDYPGGVDPNAPQLAALFEPDRFPGISALYRVNSWLWNCGTHGCPGPPISNPEVTLVELPTGQGEAIFIPERGPQIYGGGFKAMVLYAEQRRITLGYTRQDTVAPGYAVHLEDVCVDPNLLALYQAQTNAEGWHNTGFLPGLRSDQALGTARSSQIRVAIRDKGTFLDPRSRKDWWQGY